MEENVRKLGLDHSDLPTMLCNVAFLLRINCVNIFRKAKQIPWILYILNIVCFGSYTYAYVVSMVWFTFVRCQQTRDFAAGAVYFSIAACSGCVTKFFYMQLKTESVRNLVEEYLRCDALVVPHTRYASNILKYMRVVKKRATVIWTSLMMNGLIYCLLPFVKPGRHLTEDMFVIYGLEPMFQSPNYEIAMTLLILGVCFSCFTLSNSLMFMLTIVGYIEAQMKALSEELINVWDDSKKFYDKYSVDVEIDNGNDLEIKIRNVFIKNRLQDIVRFHVMSITLRDRAEKELRFIFIVDFLLRFLGTVAELLGGLENTYLELPYTFVQLYIECDLGQGLLDASHIFENSLYACNWENFDVANRKLVLFMLQCSKRSLTLSAGGIAILSYTFLMQAIKTTYSAYTAMRSTMDK